MWINKIKYLENDEVKIAWISNEKIKSRSTVFYRKIQWISKEELLEFALFFTKELNKISTSGIPLLEGMENLVIENTKNEYLNTVLQKIIFNLKRGESISSAIKEFDHIFPIEFISSIATAEECGELIKVTDKLKHYIEWKLISHKKIKSVIKKNLLLAGVISVACVFIMIFLVPAMEKTLISLNIQAPWYSKIIFYIAKNIELSLVAIVFISVILMNEKTRNFMWLKIKKIKAIRSLYYNYYQSIYFSQLSISYAAGIPLISAFKSISEQNSHSTEWGHKFAQIYHDANQGIPFSQVLSNELGLSKNASLAIKSAEKTGRLDETLTELAKEFDMSYKEKIDAIYATLYPVLMVFLSIILVWIILSTITPLYSVIGEII